MVCGKIAGCFCVQRRCGRRSAQCVWRVKAAASALGATPVCGCEERSAR